jgi:NADPH:quinone reductase-like Zn-dependent oxidoreductase
LFSLSKRVLAPQGRHVFVVQTLRELLQALWTSMRRGKRVIVGFSGGNSKDDLLLIKRLLEAGRIRPVIDRAYGLEDIVDAHRFVDTGRKRGGVAVSINPAFEHGAA